MGQVESQEIALEWVKSLVHFFSPSLLVALAGSVSPKFKAEIVAVPAWNFGNAGTEEMKTSREGENMKMLNAKTENHKKKSEKDLPHMEIGFLPLPPNIRSSLRRVTKVEFKDG